MSDVDTNALDFDASEEGDERENEAATRAVAGAVKKRAEQPAGDLAWSFPPAAVAGTTKAGGRKPRAATSTATTAADLTTRVWELEGEVAVLQRKLERAQEEAQTAGRRVAEAESAHAAELAELRSTVAKSERRAAEAEEAAKHAETRRAEDVARVEAHARETIKRLQEKLDAAVARAAHELEAAQAEANALRGELERVATAASAVPAVAVAPPTVPKPATPPPPRMAVAVPGPPPSRYVASPQPPPQQQQQQQQWPHDLVERAERLAVQNESLRAALWREREERAEDARKRDAQIELAQQRADEAVARALNVTRALSHGGSSAAAKAVVVRAPRPQPQQQQQRRRAASPSFALPTASSMARSSSSPR